MDTNSETPPKEAEKIPGRWWNFRTAATKDVAPEYWERRPTEAA